MSTTATATEDVVDSLVTLQLSAADTTGRLDLASYRYAHYLPTYPDDHYPPLEPFEFHDPALRALEHENPRSFLDTATSVIELTPRIGSEVRGVSLVKLNEGERDQLALEVARRGVVVFRDQHDFINSDPEFLKSWGRHFGRLHIHPVSGQPKGIPEFHLVYREPKAQNVSTLDFSDRITSTIWHSDVSYELQPPGLTALFLLSQPPSGGDTIFASQVAALKRLSPQFVDFLRTLKAVHSGVEQAESARNGTRRSLRGSVPVRRDPVENVHPVVRKHPVTGEEALYINSGFTRYIVGLKKEESDALLKFLYAHISASADVHVRVKWSPESVVLWDNRVTAHTAIADFDDQGHLRHGIRITPQAERPFSSLEVAA
ncbi:TauD-domain-containing protein [Fistulina hepatica ATCC 64428]|uniref:TauD-domain-containing protein n=1 Tax=Fistulina hepatica ATCC 64428 TaxID=1128425 RepID=A0A0D7AH26_9AGAR|nr:TauD-domain-containing protein [Fistulina hepatica ATCC 64428]